MPRKGASKRPAPDSAPAAPGVVAGRRLSQRVADKPALDLDERRAGGPMLRQESDRIFWEQWDTALLWTWIKDYDRDDVAMTAALKADREALLRILVESDWVQRPAEGKELKELGRVWAHVTGAHKADPRPGFFDFAAAAQEAKAAQAAAPHTPAPAAPASSARKRASDSFALDSDGDDVMEGRPPVGRAAAQPASQEPARINLAAQFGAQVPAARDPFAFKNCPHCSCRNPNEVDLQFQCVFCGLFAGLPFTHALNQAKMAGIEGPKAPAAAAASSSSVPTGQLLADIFEGSTATQRREKELKEYLKLPHNPMFDAMVAGAQFPHTAALEIGRQAFNASAYEMPSPTLLQAIRAGVLIKPGFAKPRLISDAMERGPGLSVGGGVLSTPVTTIPKIESVSEFAMAMFSTILPALADRPKALAEWCALGRTVLELNTQKGSWAIAASYLDQLLTERTYAREPYATTSLSVMTSVVFTGPSPAYGGGARGPQQYPPPTQQQVQNPRFCGDYNFRSSGCTRLQCAYKHECQYGTQGCTDTKGHRSADCPRRPRPKDGKAGDGGGSVRSAPASGAGGASAKK